MKLTMLHEDLGQPKAKKKKVWDVDEHVGRGTDKQAQRDAYHWSKTGVFSGQSEGYEEHII